MLIKRLLLFYIIIRLWIGENAEEMIVWTQRFWCRLSYVVSPFVAREKWLSYKRISVLILQRLSSDRRKRWGNDSVNAKLLMCAFGKTQTGRFENALVWKGPENILFLYRIYQLSAVLFYLPELACFARNNGQQRPQQAISAGKRRIARWQCAWQGELGEIWRFKIRNLLYNPRRTVLRKPCPDQVFFRSTKDRSVKCLHFICPQQRGQIGGPFWSLRHNGYLLSTRALGLGVVLIREGRKGSDFLVSITVILYFYGLTKKAYFHKRKDRNIIFLVNLTAEGNFIRLRNELKLSCVVRGNFGNLRRFFRSECRYSYSYLPAMRHLLWVRSGSAFC